MNILSEQIVLPALIRRVRASCNTHSEWQLQKIYEHNNYNALVHGHSKPQFAVQQNRQVLGTQKNSMVFLDFEKFSNFHLNFSKSTTLEGILEEPQLNNKTHMEAINFRIVYKYRHDHTVSSWLALKNGFCCFCCPQNARDTHFSKKLRSDNVLGRLRCPTVRQLDIYGS